jgi:hypothetical protein
MFGNCYSILDLYFQAAAAKYCTTLVSDVQGSCYLSFHVMAECLPSIPINALTQPLLTTKTYELSYRKLAS